VTARGTQPAQSEWYYSHDAAKGLGLVVNVMAVDSASDVNVTVDFGPGAIDSAAFDGVFPSIPVPLHRLFTALQVHGAIRRALLAKANTDMDRFGAVAAAIVDDYVAMGVGATLTTETFCIAL
jgi:ABC-type glycerol-3-phosphate transport system substrate-binding protein